MVSEKSEYEKGTASITSFMTRQLNGTTQKSGQPSTISEIESAELSLIHYETKVYSALSFKMLITCQG